MGSVPQSKLAAVILSNAKSSKPQAPAANESTAAGNPFLAAKPAESIAPQQTQQENSADGQVQVKIPVAQEAHGAGCSHCMSQFIGQKVVTAKRGEVAQLGQEAASKALSGAKQNMLAETRRHEEAHASTAQSYGLQTGPIKVNDDGSGSVDIQVPEMPQVSQGDTGASSKLQAFMNKAKGLRAAAMAPKDPSGQDYKVAQAGDGLVAKAQAMLAKVMSGFNQGGSKPTGAESQKQIRSPFNAMA